MISYRLVCGANHRFEGWFRNSEAFDEQATSRELACPICGNQEIRKDIMAPSLARSRSLGDPLSNAPVEVEKPEPARGVPDQTTGSEVAASPPKPVAVQPTKMNAAEVQKFATFVAMARKVHDYVEKNFDNVGKELPEEARKIHYGEVDHRNIYGQATTEEADELRDEGIELQALPVLPKLDS